MVGAAEVEPAFALEDLEHGRADVAPGAGVGAGPQPVELGADGGHDVAAGGRVGVPDRGMARFGGGGVALVLEGELLVQRGVGVLPAVARDRRAGLGVETDQRAQARVHPQPLGPGDVGGGLVGHAVGSELEEPGVGVVDERDVEAVDPRHRVVGLVVVPVEVPAGGEQEVAAAHGHRIAVDHGPHAFTLDDEPEGVLRVPVLGRGLLGSEVLDRRPQRGGDVGDAAESGVGQGDGTPLTAAAHRDEVTGPLSERVQGRPLPHERHGLRRRHHRHQVAELGPQRVEVLGLEVRVELLQLGIGVLGCGHDLSS